jgi:hypothetical protein
MYIINIPQTKNVRRGNKMGKPRLPHEIEMMLPIEIVSMINKYIPRLPKPKKCSASLQRALEALQKSPKRSSMDLYGLDDFVL